MENLTLIAADLIAVTLLTFGLYFPRHRRRDLVPAFLVVNAGVLAVALVLGTSGATVGLGLGLFGVLSIIRLRSSEIEQHEVAYYFASLALGLIAGLGAAMPWAALGLMALVLAVLAIGDHPAVFRRYRQQRVRLERAITDEGELTAHLEQLLGARVHGVRVEELDLVNDTALVDVRYRVDQRGRLGRIAARHGAPIPAMASADVDAAVADARTTARHEAMER
ncbi:DUF4956 domain-containing protein [Agromyces sp. NPDC004153]